MPHEEPAIPEEPAIHDAPAQDTAVQAQQMPAYEPPVMSRSQRSTAEGRLPRGTRGAPHRLLGGGCGNPIPLALLGVLLAACGFIGGVLIEKGQTISSSSSGARRRPRLALCGASRRHELHLHKRIVELEHRLRPADRRTVAYLDGSTLYVTNSEGNTVKVTTSAGTTVTKTVKSTLTGIHPGETVTITGATGSSGAVSAESISVGSSGGGLAALFGGSGTGSSRSGSSSKNSSEPPLFGSGG